MSEPPAVAGGFTRAINRMQRQSPIAHDPSPYQFQINRPLPQAVLTS